MKKEKIKKKNLFLFIIIIFFIILLITSCIKIINYLSDNYRNKNIQETIIEDYVNIIEPTKENQKTEYNIDFKSLKEQNPDTIAYLKVNNTNIDYIVVKGKDNNYYLKHNFEKKWNVSGWIFADYHNKFDNNDKNIVIFGHNTRDGSMFGTLKNVINKEWYENKENYEIILVTENDTYRYQVFSTYTIKPENYYINTNFENNNTFNEFIRKIKLRSVYNYNVDVTTYDKILTLSSCIDDGKKRVVLHAKLLKN